MAESGAPIEAQPQVPAQVAETQVPAAETPEQSFERNLIADPREAFHQAVSVLAGYHHPGQVRPPEWEQREGRAWEAFSRRMIATPVPVGGTTGPTLTVEQT